MRQVGYIRTCVISESSTMSYVRAHYGSGGGCDDEPVVEHYDDDDDAFEPPPPDEDMLFAMPTYVDGTLEGGAPIVVVGGGGGAGVCGAGVAQPGTHNGMTASATAATNTLSTSPPRPPLKPALGHIDFWPSCQTRALRASDSTFETFE